MERKAEKDLVLKDDFEAPKGMVTADPAALAAAETAKQRIQAAYIMAAHKPRNVEDSRQRILKACKRPLFAERVEYSKPVSNKNINGPSIRFAELALREWGNINSDIQVVHEDANIRRVKVYVTDLETNATFTKEISIKKTVERKNAKGREVVGERTNTKGQKVFIVLATDDELHNKEAALISKALRNEGLRLIPSDITDEAVDTARKTLKKRDAEDPEAAKRRVLDAFGTLNITPSDLAGYLGHTIDRLSVSELDHLRAIYTAISEGEARWEDYLEGSERKEKKDAVSLDEVMQGKVTEEPEKELPPKDDEAKDHNIEEAREAVDPPEKPSEPAGEQKGNLFEDRPICDFCGEEEAVLGTEPPICQDCMIQQKRAKKKQGDQ